MTFTDPYRTIIVEPAYAPDPGSEPVPEPDTAPAHEPEPVPDSEPVPGSGSR